MVQKKLVAHVTTITLFSELTWASTALLLGGGEVRQVGESFALDAVSEKGSKRVSAC